MFPRGRWQQPHFTDEEPEAQKDPGKLRCLEDMVELRFESTQSAPKLSLSTAPCASEAELTEIMFPVLCFSNTTVPLDLGLIYCFPLRDGV